jgi:hypothetical protein
MIKTACRTSISQRLAKCRIDPREAVADVSFGHMAKKRPNHPRRTDAERRARQSERLSRHLRVLYCIMGPGRWDSEALARELEVSPRTIHRIMQTLSMANVPWYFCKDTECYRVREGFRFPGLEPGRKGQPSGDPDEVLAAARKVLSDSEKLVDSLRFFCRILETGASGAES